MILPYMIDFEPMINMYKLVDMISLAIRWGP